MSFFFFFLLDKILRIENFNKIAYIISVEWFESINRIWYWAKNYGFYYLLK